MARRSAGVLLYRRTYRPAYQPADRPADRPGPPGAATPSPVGVEVLLGHIGGPYFARKDAGAWSILKGEYGEGEEPLDVARREFTEETGHPAPRGAYVALGEVRQANGKIVTAWAVEGDLDPAAATSNTCEIEWPPRSGRVLVVPEVDRVDWFQPDAARPRLVRGQAPLVDRLLEHLTTTAAPSP